MSTALERVNPILLERLDNIRMDPDKYSACLSIMLATSGRH